MPAAELQPYAPESPVYRAVPSGVEVAPWSGSIVPTQTFRISHNTEVPPIYSTDPGNPDWTVTINNRVYTLKLPDTIQKGGGADYPLVILDPPTGREFRMFQVTINAPPTRTITCVSGGVGLYGQSSGIDGRALLYRSHAGSGLSYLYGMVRRHELQAGRIPHAVRISSNYIGGSFVSPADRTDQTGTTPTEVPMGTRAFIDHSVDLDDPAIIAAVNGATSDTLNRAAAMTLLRAFQEFGMLFADGSATIGHVLYFEDEITANWVPVAGATNGLGTYNTDSIGGALEAAMAVIGYSNLKYTTALSTPQLLPAPEPLSTHTGTAANLAGITAASITGVTGGDNQTYVLSIGHRGTAAAPTVTGGGLTWTALHSRNSARGQAFLKQFIAHGSPTGPFNITITFPTSVVTISAVVTRMSGAAPGTPAWSSAVTAGTDLQDALHAPVVPAGGGLEILTAVGRVPLITDEDNFTVAGTADIDPGSGGRIVVRQYYRKIPTAAEFTDDLYVRYNAITDWIMSAGVVPALYPPSPWRGSRWRRRRPR